MFKMFKIDWNAIILFAITLFVLALCTSCAQTDELLQQGLDEHRAFVCMESERSGIYTVFSASRKTRTVIIPVDTELTKEEWIDIINRCFMNEQQADLLQLIRSLEE